MVERKKLSRPQKLKIGRGQNWICGRCHEKMDEMGFDIHHKNTDPSNNDIANLEALCVPCHRKVTQKENREKDTKKKPLFNKKNHV